ncbi:MAG: alginate export family protein [Bryobacteraceae bacterium]
MKRGIVFLFAVSAGFICAQQTGTFSPMDEVNGQLPYWLRFTGEERLRLEGFSGGGFQPDNSDGYLLNRFRFNMKLLPASWLKFQFQVEDSRVWFKDQKPYGPPYQNTWDLRVAYVELGNTEKGLAGLRVGRQELSFGDERLVGPSPWSNTPRTFDAARGTLRHGKFRVDIFASSVVAIQDGQVGESQAGNDLHGIYGGLDNVIPNSTLEPYVFWRLAPRMKAETGGLGNLDSKTIGVRWVGKLPANFDYGTEMALQRGSLGTDSIRAWAGHWVTGYTFANLRPRPRLMVEYNYASGDANAKDGVRGTFDQLYPSDHDKYGLVDQVGWKNIHHLRSGVELKPRAKWAMSAKYSSYWLADAHDALYTTANVVLARSPSGAAGRFVGQEIDATALYTFSKQMQFGGGVGHIIPGEFLKKTTPGAGYTYPYILFNYAF